MIVLLFDFLVTVVAVLRCIESEVCRAAAAAAAARAPRPQLAVVQAQAQAQVRTKVEDGPSQPTTTSDLSSNPKPSSSAIIIISSLFRPLSLSHSLTLLFSRPTDALSTRLSYSSSLPCPPGALFKIPSRRSLSPPTHLTSRSSSRFGPGPGPTLLSVTHDVFVLDTTRPTLSVSRAQDASSALLALRPHSVIDSTPST